MLAVDTTPLTAENLEATPLKVVDGGARPQESGISNATLSPIPLVVEEALRLVGKPAADLLRDLNPAARQAA